MGEVDMRLQNLIALVIVSVALIYVLVGRGEVTITSAGAASDRPIPSAEPTPIIDDSILVHVSGAVAAPGVVALPTSARVVDAVAAAGGALRDADLASLNLVTPIRDGDHIVVPSHDGGGGAQQVDRTEQEDGVVRINNAGVGELMELPGIGPVLAERIVRHRESHGPFSEVEGLLDVAGIGEARLAELRELIAL